MREGMGVGFPSFVLPGPLRLASAGTRALRNRNNRDSAHF